MPADISADVAYLGGVWAEGVLYGIHIVIFFTLCYIFTSSAYTRGREKSSQILLAYATIMFILSTTHVALALSELLQGFVLEGGELTPAAFYRINVFPKRKAIYIVNTLLGDSLLIWRVYVIYGHNWLVCAPCLLVLLATITCGLKTIVANGIFASSSVFDPSILSWITSFFVLTIVTQIAATILIAARIYAASQPFQISGEVVEAEMGDDVRVVGRGDSEKEKDEEVKVNLKARGGGRNLKYEPTQREKYLATVWLVVESGFIYSSAAIVQLVTYLMKMNAGVIMEFMLSQLSAIVPMVIVVRIGLGLAYQGASSTRRDYHDPSSSSSALPSSGRRNNNGQLSTFKAASHHHEDRDEDEGLQNSISLGGSSSRTKLDIGTRKGSEDSSLGMRVAGDGLDGSRNSGERNVTGEKEGLGERV